jgi:cytochrome c peroxidase
MGDLDGPDLVTTPDPSNPVHFGRGGFTGRDEDRYRFKTPQLYNLADHAAFGHGATFPSIRAVIEYKNEGVPQSPYVPSHRLAPPFQPLRLTPAEIDDLVAFLKHGLYDPDLQRYAPRALPSGHCFPNNDVQSRRDLHCEAATDSSTRP